MEEGDGIGSWRIWKTFSIVGMACIKAWRSRSNESSLEHNICTGQCWELKLIHQIGISLWKVLNGKQGIKRMDIFTVSPVGSCSMLWLHSDSQTGALWMTTAFLEEREN